MSGHSHWSKIKHSKKNTDAERGKIFSKMARLISHAARQGGDQETNPKLREAIEKAKQANLPSVNTERAVKRGIGELGETKLEEVLFEAYGPDQIAIIIEGITDNKNRTLAEIKQILNKHNGKLANEGSVTWMFERKGIILLRNTNECEYTNIKDKEDLELIVIETGAEDFTWNDQELEIYTTINDLENIKKRLNEKSIKIESSTLGWMAKKEISVPNKQKQAIMKLFEALDENDAVQEIYSNLKV